MKNLKLSILFFATLLGLGLASCSKSNLSEEDAMRLNATLNQNTNAFSDSISKVKVEYSITLLDASTTTFVKAALANSPLAGSTVSITQSGKVVTSKVDSLTGMVTFKNIRSGVTNVSIKATGYLDVNLTVDINSSYRSSNLIGMIPSTATKSSVITGVVTYESDLTNLESTCRHAAKTLCRKDGSHAAEYRIRVSWRRLEMGTGRRRQV